MDVGRGLDGDMITTGYYIDRDTDDSPIVLRVLGDKGATKRIIDYNFTGQKKFQIGFKRWFDEKHIVYDHKSTIVKLFRVATE